MKAIPMHAIPRILNCFLFHNYSAIAQAEATIADAFRATEFQLETYFNLIIFRNPWDVIRRLCNKDRVATFVYIQCTLIWVCKQQVNSGKFFYTIV